MAAPSWRGRMCFHANETFTNVQEFRCGHAGAETRRRRFDGACGTGRSPGARLTLAGRVVRPTATSGRGAVAAGREGGHRACSAAHFR
jgi:hypothetical protein